MIKGSGSAKAWPPVTLGWCPKHDDTRWLMHNAVLLRPTGLVQVGMTRTFAKTRAEAKVGEECPHITKEQCWAGRCTSCRRCLPRTRVDLRPDRRPRGGRGRGRGPGEPSTA